MSSLSALSIGAALLHAPPAVAQEDESCAACSSDEATLLTPEEAVEFLDLPPNIYTVSWIWVETAPADPERTLTGIRVAPNDGTSPFDVYVDDEWNILGSDERAQLGIADKEWAAEPVSVETDYAPATGRGPTPRIFIPFDTPAESAPVLTLAEPDMAAVRAEDATLEADPSKPMYRTGVFNVFPEPVVVSGSAATHGAWQTLQDGTRVWNLIIESPGAIGQRVHFVEFQRSAGIRVSVYAAGDPSDGFRLDEIFQERTTDLWSPTVFDERVVVECVVPPTSDPSGLQLELDRIVHMYRDVAPKLAKGAGPCNLDVTCFSEWESQASGVGGLGTIGFAGSLFCTGTLIADLDPITNTPYFLTAFHCVSDAADADTVEVYWLYQTDTCNGVPPNILTVPRTTGGADFLAGMSRTTGTDFALLELRNQPPPGVGFVGWTSAVQAIGSDTITIHHPQGDFKRISFGDLTQNPDSCPVPGSIVPSRFHQSTWNNGTTEPGSSGSPLFNDAGLIIGQLWGGCASCTDLRPDYYGRFDVTFPIIQPIIGVLPPGAIPAARVPFFRVPSAW